MSRVCVCVATVRPRLVGDVVLDQSMGRLSKGGQVIRAPRLLALERRQTTPWTTSEQIALDESLPAYRLLMYRL